MRCLGFAFVVLVTHAFAPPVAAQQAASGATLYTANLETGRLSSVGTIGDGDAVVGLAVVEDGDTTTAFALTADGRLLTFDPADPETITDEQTISGLVSGDALVGLDVRPATGVLYALGRDSYVYTIDAETGTANAVGDAFEPELDGVAFGFDFNPTVDRIRVVSGRGQNLRLNPETGLIGSNPDTGDPTVDADLSYVDDDDNADTAPAVAGAGYTNSVDGAEETTLYVIDVALDVLTTQDPPNDGVLNTVGSLGVDARGRIGFDIVPSGDAYVAFTTAAHRGTPATTPAAQMDMPTAGVGTAVASARNAPALVAAVLAVAALAVAWGARPRRA